MKPLALLAALPLVATLAWAGEPAAAPAPAPVQAPVLAEETYARLRAQVLPSAGESAWREVGWRPTFGEAVAEARRTRRPVFLWAMNGHPLACV
ncbi:MAG: hypothetical protein ACKOSS_10390 [Planctomycetia bacterium]